MNTWVDDALAPFRDRILGYLRPPTSVVLLMFAMWHAAEGQTALAVIAAAAPMVLLADGWTAGRGRRRPPLEVVGASMVLAVTGSTWFEGVNGMLWAYPLLFILYFVLPRTSAQVLAVILLMATTATTAHAVSSGVGLRTGLTMALTILMINTVLSVISTLQHALFHQAITDPLTGTRNRRSLHHDLAGTSRTAGVVLAVDIDHFKAVNDRFGHATGDLVICGVVGAMRGLLRTDDDVYRVGGEEFVVRIHDVTPQEGAAIAERLRSGVEAAALLPSEPVTVSIGVARPTPDRPYETWLADADDALYAAKRSGRNRVVVASAVHAHNED